MSSSSLPKTFKAAQIAGPNQPWKIVDSPHRELARNEVLIKVLASGICASDHLVEAGTWPGLSYPRVAGHEVVGRVVSAGSEINPEGRFKAGALVGVGWNGGYCGTCDSCREGDYTGCSTMQVSGITFDGGHAEYIYAPESSIVSIPESAAENVSYAQLAPLMCAGSTVYGAIRASSYSPGDICVVQGVGGLGHLAIQFAAKLGLKVYALTTSPSKRELAKSLGAHGTFDPSTAVVELKKLGGAKLILCTAPNAESVSALIPAASRNGTIMVVGASGGKVEISHVSLIVDRTSLRGWSCGAARDTEECINFATLSGVHCIVETFPLSDFANAYEGLKSGNPKFRNVITFPE